MKRIGIKLFPRDYDAIAGGKKRSAVIETSKYCVVGDEIEVSHVSRKNTLILKALWIDKDGVKKDHVSVSFVVKDVIMNVNYEG